MRPSKYEVVLDTAERLFYNEGFHATGIDRVTAQAGVARMTLYNHFASKEALVEAVLERRFQRYLDALHEARASARPGTAVRALTEVHARWLETVSTQSCIVMKAIGEYGGHSAAIAEQGRRLKRELRGCLAEAVTADGFDDDDGQRGERLLVIFEGADAVGPVLGVEVATEHLHALVDTALADAVEVAS
jgi:AcrR family transcriptional regulator